jgi:hypothetical protein
MRPAHRFGSVRPALQPFGKVLEICLQLLACRHVSPPMLGAASFFKQKALHQVALRVTDGRTQERAQTGGDSLTQMNARVRGRV